jgi:hypothetical protein
MGAVVLVPAIISIWYIRKSGPASAFVYVYLTTLLMLPGWARWNLAGLPDPTFDEAAILPLVVAYVPMALRTWRLSLLDFLVVVLLLVMGLSEYVNAGWADAQNLIFDLLFAGLAPYVLAKGLLNGRVLRANFARRFVWCMAINLAISAYEFRFAYSPWRKVLDHFFPGMSSGWVTTFRYGHVRLAGPFSHAILNGIVAMIALQFALWLKDNRLWAPHIRFPRIIQNPLSRFSKSTLLVVSMAVNLILSFTRGPQIGAVIAWTMVWVSRARRPKTRLATVLVLLVFIGIPLGVWFSSYVSVGRNKATSQTQETAAYRKELVDKYVEIAMKKGWLGWGTSGWPRVNGMSSIDNFYLLLTLMHGLLATCLLWAILFCMVVRLLWYGLNSRETSMERSLAFTLLGIYLGLSFSLATVYMGLNVIPIFFMVTGYSEGLLVYKRELRTSLIPFHFERVVA